MKLVNVRVFYRYPDSGASFHKDYTVPENEPFVEAAAYKQWQRDLTIPHQMVAFSGTRIVDQAADAPIVQLPLGFCATKFPGYFWDSNEHKLYSLKSGLLKELPLLKNNYYINRAVRDQFVGYAVSNLGKRRLLKLGDLQKLVPTHCLIAKATTQKPQGSRWS